MFVATKELPVNLRDLDPYLKAILKSRIREFVYLHPCFQDVPSGISASFEAELNLPGEHLQAQLQPLSDNPFDESARISLKTQLAKKQLERLYRA